MNKKIYILIIILIILAVVVGFLLYDYWQKIPQGPGGQPQPGINGQITNQPAVGGATPTPVPPKPELSAWEEKFFCYNAGPNPDEENSISGSYFYDDYILRVYECVGYNDVSACEANWGLLDKVIQRTSTKEDVIRTCQNNSNGVQYLKTGDVKFLEAIYEDYLKNAYLAARKNDASLCSADFPFCKSLFSPSCIIDDQLLSNRKNLLNLADVNSHIDPSYSRIGREDKEQELRAEINKNKDEICRVLSLENQVLLKQLASCDQISQDKNLMEREAYLRCSSFLQSDRNFCLEELQRLTSDSYKYYINNNCVYP